MSGTGAALDDAAVARAVETLWSYHNLRHELRRTDVGIGLGSHDLGVATTAATLYRRGLFPLVVFTGANSPTTVDRFPRGEAAHYRDHAVGLGVPSGAIMIEGVAANTGENITRTRDLLASTGRVVQSVTLISRPYQQRRAYATCRKLWPEVEPICAATALPLDEYIASIGDEARVINMLVGDTQRIEVYADRGFAIRQPIPDSVREAMGLLVDRGFTQRLI
ncbi:MAG: YdcF family protein [Pseudonocardia sp.]